MTLSNTSAAETGEDFSPRPLLDAFENFQGCFVDLEHNVTISASELRRLKDEILQSMRGLGLRAGECLVTAPPNGTLFAAVWAASLELGASPILAHENTPQLELEHMAWQWGARFVVAAATGDSRGMNITEGSRTVTSHGELGWRQIALDDSHREPLRLVSVPLHPTSGTSGGPKIALRPGRCAVAEPLHYIETLGLDKSDSILCATPMSHAYAYGMCLVAALLTSARLLFMRHFNPTLLLGAINHQRVSVFPAVPFMLDAMLAAAPGQLTGRPRITLSAGAPLPPETVEKFRERWGLAIRPLYGTTETGGIAIGWAEDGAQGGVGHPMKGVEVDLHAADGHSNILRVRSGSMMAGYLEGGQVSRAVLTDGWLETGDLARIDERGRIHLQGRLSEVINVFGFKVIPKEVEEVIAMLPEVAEVKVYGAHWKGEEEVEAAVVRRAPIDEGQILKHCDQHLVSYKCPTAIHFVESLPRTAAGKIAMERLPGRGKG